MIGLRIDDDLDLCLPLERHAGPLFELIDSERARIQEWVDVSATRTVDDQRPSWSRPAAPTAPAASTRS